MPIWRQPPQPTQSRPQVIESVDNPIGGRIDAIRAIASIWEQPPQPQQRNPRVTEAITPFQPWAIIM